MLTLSAGKELLMLCAGIQDPLKLQLTELAKVDNISWQAIPEGVAGLWQRNSTAAATDSDIGTSQGNMMLLACMCAEPE